MKKEKKNKSAFDIVHDPAHFKTMLSIAKILGNLISQVAIPQGMKKKDLMDIVEAMWDQCPYIEHKEN